jgi:formylglycine-generating enzyme
MKRSASALLVVSALLASSACGGGKAAPVAPTPVTAAAPTTASPSGCRAGTVGVHGGTFNSGERAMPTAVADFCLDATEVTVAAYTACAKSGQCAPVPTTVDWPKITDAQRASESAACTGGRADQGDHPLACVDWNQATTYCRAQGARLPTEAEWEWAARGGAEGRMYPWGSAAPDAQLCWSGASKRSGTCAVGSFPAGDAPGGIHDLAGNLWEWTAGDFDATGTTHAIRGGDWSSNNEYVPDVQVTARVASPPGERHKTVGFRCAR